MGVVHTFEHLKFYARYHQPSASVECSDHLIHALVLQLTSNLEPLFIVEGVEAQLPSPWLSEASIQILDCFGKLPAWSCTLFGLLQCYFNIILHLLRSAHGVYSCTLCKKVTGPHYLACQRRQCLSNLQTHAQNMFVLTNLLPAITHASAKVLLIIFANHPVFTA